MASLPLIAPSDCTVVLMDYQVGLAFAAALADRWDVRRYRWYLAGVWRELRDSIP